MVDIETHSDGYALRMGDELDEVVEVKDRLRPKADWRLGRNVWVVGDSLAETEELVEMAAKRGYEWSPDAWAKASSVLDRGRDRLSGDSLEVGLVDEIGRDGLTLREYQAEGVRRLVEFERGFLMDEMGLGKGHPLDERVLTPTGWREVSDLEVGDQVIGSDGEPTRVTGIYDRGTLPVYEVEMCSGASVRVDSDHLWAVTTPTRKHRGSGYKVERTESLVGNLRDEAGNRRYFIPLVNPVNFDVDEDLPLDPYLLGLLIGDGSFRPVSTPRVSTADDYILDRIKELSPQGAVVRHKSDYDYLISFPNQRGNPLSKILKDLGLWGRKSTNKFIPEEYKMGPIGVRRALAKGLLDSDGSVCEGASWAEYSTASEQLKEDFLFIARSLGWRAKCKERESSWRIHIKLPKGEIPFRLPRKRRRWNEHSKHHANHAIESIREHGEAKVRCIEVEAEDSLYVTEDFIVTHNTVQTIAALDVIEAYPALVVAPSNGIWTWAGEIRSWATLTSPDVQVVPSTSEGIEPADIWVTTWDLMRMREDEWRRRELTAVVFDEAHRMRNHRAGRSQAALRVAKGIPYRWGLTGTLFVNGLKDVLHPAKVLGVLGRLGGWDYVTKRFCDKEKVRVGWDPAKREPIYKTDLSGYDDEERRQEARDKLMTKMLKTCAIRREKSQVVDELPEKTKQVIQVDPTNRDEYDELAAKLDEGDPLARINKLSHKAALGKIEPVIERANDVLHQDEKVVIFTYHRDVLAEIEASFDEDDVAVIDGSTPSRERERTKRAFQHEDKPRVLVANIKAAGEAMTFTRASTALFCEVWWNSATHSQGLDRLHRIGQTEPVRGEFFLARGTVDEHKWRIVEEKRHETNVSVTDLAREVQEAMTSS